VCIPLLVIQELYYYVSHDASRAPNLQKRRGGVARRPATVVVNDASKAARFRLVYTHPARSDLAFVYSYMCDRRLDKVRAESLVAVSERRATARLS